MLPTFDQSDAEKLSHTHRKKQRQTHNHNTVKPCSPSTPAKIMFGRKYKDFVNALLHADLENLSERRKKFP